MNHSAESLHPDSSAAALGDFAVLMAVYAGESALFLAAALASLRRQQLGARQIVVVEDGPLTPALYQVLDQYQQCLPLKRILLARNQGLAAALQQGLQVCDYELVARMDADDIAVPERFARQVAVMQARPELSVLGSYVAEFADDPAQPYALRRVPLGVTALAVAARWRCPLNHPSVILRKTPVLAVGGYEGFRGIEDYYLWGRLLVAGKQLDNLPEVLMQVRAGSDLGRRRGGWVYARRELQLYGVFWRMGFMTWYQALAGVLLRLPVRLMPAWLRAWIYQRAIRSAVRDGPRDYHP